MALESNQPLTEKEFQENFLGDKGGRCVRLTLLLSFAASLEIWEPQPPGTPRPAQASNGVFFYIFTFVVHK